jgi:putative transposase
MAAAGAPIHAIALRSPVGTICHSDRGGQFRAKRTQRLLANNGLVGSMGRSYGAGDNASMERFFSLLQNVLDTQRWETREELGFAMVTWIETKYNRRRRQRGLGKLTPVEFEMIYAAAEAA